MRIHVSESQATSPLLPVWLTIPSYLLTSILLIMLLSVLTDASFSAFDWYSPFFLQLSLSLAMFLSVFGSALLFLRYLDCTPISELGLSFKDRISDSLLAVSLAVLLYILGFSVLFLLGAIQIVSVHFDASMLIGSFFFFLVVALAEETMVRGYILSRLMSCMNKFVALFISSIIFASLHLFNAHVSFLPIFNIFLAGLLLGSSFIYTRNLCFPLVLHLLWNWLQGPLLGFEVSGSRLGSSLLVLRLSDQKILNGGDFGFEGSIICTALLVIATIGIIYGFEKRNRKMR